MCIRDSYYDDIVILMGTGLRVSELYGLIRADIDFERHCIHVRRPLCRTAEKPYFVTPPKTKSGIRNVPMTDTAVSYTHLKSKEVVRMGFQSNFLFQNISNVFSAPQEVLDILQNFQPISEAKAKPIQITPDTGADLSLNDKGEVDLDEGYVIGKAADVFGAKIYESTPALDTALQDLTDAPAKEEHLEPLKKSITKEIITPMLALLGGGAALQLLGALGLQLALVDAVAVS